MKEIINAPVYEDTPLQDVAKRFWNALHENHKIRSKNEDRLEHDLGKLKGVYGTKPSAGPHKTRECIPLNVLLQQKLKYALSR